VQIRSKLGEGTTVELSLLQANEPPPEKHRQHPLLVRRGEA
jgi:hypothetical protein